MENFNKVYKENSTFVFNFFLKKLYNKDVDLAKDLTQDTFIKVANNLHTYDDNKSKMATWIITIAKNVLIDYSRKKQLNTQSISSFVDDDGKEMFHVKIESKTTPLSELVNSQLGEGIQLAFSKLPNNYKQYAELLFNRQLTYDEIADELQQPLGTVKASIHRTRELLHEALKTVRS